MGLVDFTNPDATAWFQGKLRALVDQGVDCFKTDFGERIPLDVDWFDGSDPRAHAQPLHAALQQGRARGARRGPRRGRRRAVRALGDRRRADACRCTGAATRRRRSSRWPRPCAAACRSRSAASRTGATTSAASRARRMPRSSSAGSRSGCSAATAASTARARTACRGRSTRRPVEVTRTLHAPQDAAHAVPVPGGAGCRGDRRAAACGRCSSSSPTTPRCGYLDRQYMLGADLLVAPVFTERRRGRVLPARGHVDAAC